MHAGVECGGAPLSGSTPRDAATAGLVATGEVSRWIVRRMAREREPWILHVREQREVLTALAAG